MGLSQNSFFTRYGYFHFTYYDPSPLEVVPLTRMGILFKPVCGSLAKYSAVLLEFDPSLRDYILLSQTFPVELSSYPSLGAIWTAANLQEPSSTTPIAITVRIPDYYGPLSCQTDTQNGVGLLLGVDPPEEFDLSLTLSGTIIGSIFVDVPTLSHPPVFPPLPPPPMYSNVLVDETFPPGFEYPPGFLWPSQVNTFYPWYYIMYDGEPLPPLEELPYIPSKLLSTSPV